MAEDFLPLLGHNMDNAGDDGDSDTENKSSADDEEELMDNGVGGRLRGRVGDKGEGKPRKRLTSQNYDTSLPGTHSYLGTDLEDVRGRTVYDDNSIVTLPLVPLPGVVLVPGQVIPLHLFQQHLIAALRRLADTDTDKTFGVVTYSVDFEEGLSDIGCTAELFSMKNETDDLSGLSTLRALARGRQRFKVIEKHREVTGILAGRVRILPEVSIPRGLQDARPPSMDKFCCSPTEQDDVVKTAVDRQGKVIRSVSLLVNKQIDRFSAAHLTRWPAWVYKMYDAELLKEEITKELHSWNSSLQAASLPSEPIELSYWVAQNLPLDNFMRMHLLELSCPIYRLRSEIAIIRKCAVLCCSSCMRQIARKEDVFSMSLEGPLGAYVNPGGVVHETVTLYKAENLTLISRPSSEHSWFPGFAWTIAQCRECGHHMGWKFTATNKKLTPSKFWGLCRSSLVPSFRKVSGSDVDGKDSDEVEEELILEGW